MKYLELRIHPPIIVLLAGAVAWLLSWILPSLNFSFKGQLIVVMAFLVFAGIFGSAGVMQFLRHSTTINPAKPYESSYLVTTGVYRFTRNPMYLGLLSGLLAWIVFLGNPVSFLAAIFFITYISCFQIKPEERYLQEKFGSKYSEFLGKTRRWI